MRRARHEAQQVLRQRPRSTRVILHIFVLVMAAIGIPAQAAPIPRLSPLDVRIVTYNTERNFIANPSTDAVFARLLSALSPDIVVLQEMTVDLTAAAISTRLQTITGITAWQVHQGATDGFIRTVIASRWPLTLTRTNTSPTSATRGVTIALVDLPDAQYKRDVYLMGVHLKCCGNPGGSEDVSRQRSADAIASWLGNARQPGGIITLNPYTPMIALGDFNLVGGPQPGLTLVTGNIIDEATFGPDVKGDWDVSDMTDLTPIDPFSGDNYTWQSDGVFPSSRLDRFIYTDSVTTVAQSFILNSQTMTTSALVNAGLMQTDNSPSVSSDHLPMAVDLRFDCNNNGIADPTEPDSDGDGVINACDVCAGTVPGISVDLSGCPPVIRGDFNRDGDVDSDDFLAWKACASGSALPQTSPSCGPAHFDVDDDVDMDDFGGWQRCYSGANHPADASCRL